MILIVSNSNDQSTNDVIDWLHYYHKDVIRINEDQYIQRISIEIDESSNKLLFYTKDHFVDVSRISSVWFRRGIFRFDLPLKLDLNKTIHRLVSTHLKDELKTLESYIIYSISSTASVLGDYYQKNANKLVCLCIAKRVGLDIPETMISTSKNECLRFLNKNTNCITKSIQDVLSIIFENNCYYTLTENVCGNDIENMDPCFFPSKLQKNISKRFEIRTFYLDGNCYSMAIFSQSDSQTQTDYRHYNSEHLNRTVPYVLPSVVENKIIDFMKTLGLNTGSLDLIYTIDHRYVFLEVNPVGQYDMVTVPCNYYLHEKIAKFLGNVQ